MFGHDSFLWTPVNVLQSETRTFKASEGYNSIHAVANGRYVVSFSDPQMVNGVGPLLGRGEDTITEAIATASGNSIYNDLTTYCIGSYHSDDASAVLANNSTSPDAFVYVDGEAPIVRNGGCKWAFQMSHYSITLCEDENRETKEDGSCDGECKSGYEYDQQGKCVEITDDDPNGCASANRVKGADNACGDCLSGFTEDATGGCQADTNWTMIGGGIAAVVVIGFFLKNK